MKHISRFLDAYDKILGTISVLLMVAIVFWQVFSRYVLGDPSQWSEELARYFMLYMSFMGIGTGIKLHKHVGIEAAENMLKNHKAKMAFRIVGQIITLVIICGIFYLSLITTLKVSKSPQASPSLRIPMWIPYATIPLGFAGGIFRQIEEIVHTVQSFVTAEDAADSEKEV